MKECNAIMICAGKISVVENCKSYSTYTLSHSIPLSNVSAK